MLNRKEFDNYPDAAEFVEELIKTGYVRNKYSDLGSMEFVGRETPTGFAIEWVE